MTSPNTWKTQIGKTIAMGVAILLSAAIIVFASPNLRAKLGLQATAQSNPDAL